MRTQRQRIDAVRIRDDILRIMEELDTFEQRELEELLDMASGQMSLLCQRYERRGLIERVRVGKQNLCAITKKGRQAVAKLRAVDGGERLLLLERILPQCWKCGSSNVSEGIWFEDRGGGPTYRHHDTWCEDCECLIDSQVFRDEQG